MCKECEEHRHFVCECGKVFDNALSFGGHKAKCKEHLKLLAEEREKRRLPNGLFKCENPGCTNEHDGSYGSGLFCSKKCRLSFIGKKAYETKVENGTFKSPFKNPDNGYRPPARGDWKCATCGKVFRTKREMQEHYRSDHYDGKPCQAWNKGLTKETSELVRHNSESVSKAMKKLFSEGKIDAHKMWTPKRRKEQSERKKKLYQTHPELHPNRRVANNRTKMTYPERVAYDWLVLNGIEFKHQYHYRTDKFNRYVDFYCESKSMFIEIDGKYWHDPKVDAQKDNDALEHGISTIRISATDRIESRLSSIFNL